MIQLAKTDLRGSIKTRIIEMIKEQGLNPGDKIMSQNELAKLFKIGAPTVCRALGELADDGILYRVHGKGTFVAEPLQIPETEQPTGEFTVGIYPFENYHGNDYLLELAEGISQGIMRHRFSCKYITRSKFEHSGLSIAEYMFVNQIDGIIMPGGSPHDLDLAEELRDNGFSCVLLNRYIDGCDSVTCDHYTGTTQLMEILANHGHQRIFFAGVQGEISTVKERLNGYLDFCHLHGIYEEKLVFLSDTEDRKSGIKAVDKILSMKNRPTAMIVAAGFMMKRIIKPLLESGLSIPDDISLVAYDEQHLPSKYGRFTCVKQPLEKMGATAVDIMNKNLRFNKKSAINIKFDPELIHGNSVAMNRVEKTVSTVAIASV
ncbi:MAG: GntR family transcriptional regulator [Victivallaceae bacterium]|nr:GntR family transcriptional regulator [Victivallaceae bacterium]